MLQEGEPAEVRVRCNPALRRKIRDAAEEAARSMSAEAAYRLEKSFERDEAVRGLGAEADLEQRGRIDRLGRAAGEHVLLVPRERGLGVVRVGGAVRATAAPARGGGRGRIRARRRGGVPRGVPRQARQWADVDVRGDPRAAVSWCPGGTQT